MADNPGAGEHSNIRKLFIRGMEFSRVMGNCYSNILPGKLALHPIQGLAKGEF
jgi:hypothetical protein